MVDKINTHKIISYLASADGQSYIPTQGGRTTTSVWKGIRSDTQGRFTLEDVKPDQKNWVAFSQASQAMGLTILDSGRTISFTYIPFGLATGTVCNGCRLGVKKDEQKKR